MKYFLYTTIAMNLLINVSCSKWLDIIPEDTTTQKQLFKDAGGYHSAINGLYQTMAGFELYGENLSWGFASALSQNYDNYSSDDRKKFSHTEKYDYKSEEIENFASTIWLKSYNTIANANNIIAQIDNANPTLFPSHKKGETEMIKGEALAIRGLLHFELLRLFADAPIKGADKPAIPYVKKFPSLFTTRSDIKEVLKNITEDLENAQKLLGVCDTAENGIGRPSLNTVNGRFTKTNSGGGLFFSARGTRLNFMAVTALLARVYLYGGNLDKAFEYANFLNEKYIAEHKYGWGYEKSFSDTDKDSERPHKFLGEILFSVYKENLHSDYRDNAFNNNELGKNPYALKGLDIFFKDKNDIRYSKLITSVNQDIKISSKYLKRDGGGIVSFENNIIPIIRISEMKLIMAEYFNSKGEIQKAFEIIKELQTARKVKSPSDAGSITKEEMSKIIESEFWKETLCEGQYFFYCKSHGIEQMNNNGVYIDMRGKYTLNIPDIEIPIKN